MARRRILGSLLSWVFVLSALTSGAHAQSASLQATAEVSGILVSIMRLAHLGFGQVIPGVAATIDPKTSVSAGKFEIRGARRAEFTLTVTLPIQLRAGDGPFTIPISFGPNAACYRQRDQQDLCTYYDPSNTLTERIRTTPPPNNTFYVWLGGTVIPSPSQVAGVYDGLVTAAVAYTGN